MILILVRMHHIHLTRSTTHQEPTLDEDVRLPSGSVQVSGVNQGKELSMLSQNPKKGLPTITKVKRTTWYYGLLGAVTVDTESKYIRQNEKDAEKSQIAMAEKTVISITPALLKRQLEIRLTNTFSGITRTLQTYPILTSFRKSRVERYIEVGDLEGLQSMFSSREISPFVLNERGEGLLHVCAFTPARRYSADNLQVAAEYRRPEICSFLIQLGVRPDRASGNGM